MNRSSGCSISFWKSCSPQANKTVWLWHYRDFDMVYKIEPYQYFSRGWFARIDRGYVLWFLELRLMRLILSFLRMSADHFLSYLEMRRFSPGFHILLVRSTPLFPWVSPAVSAVLLTCSTFLTVRGASSPVSLFSRVFVGVYLVYLCCTLPSSRALPYANLMPFIIVLILWIFRRPLFHDIFT